MRFPRLALLREHASGTDPAILSLRDDIDAASDRNCGRLTLLSMYSSGSSPRGKSMSTETSADD